MSGAGARLADLARVHGLTRDTSVHDLARFDNYCAEFWSPSGQTVSSKQPPRGR